MSTEPTAQITLDLERPSVTRYPEPRSLARKKAPKRGYLEIHLSVNEKLTWMSIAIEALTNSVRLLEAWGRGHENLTGQIPNTTIEIS